MKTLTLLRFLCNDCGKILADEELKYYEYRCNDCEQAWSDRINAWRFGAEDEELDAIFDGPKQITH